MGKRLWEAPWGYSEGFLLAAGLSFVGLMWQLLLPGFILQMPKWPVNFILGSVFLAIILTLRLLFSGSPVYRWLTSVPAAITAAIWFCGLSVLMGIIPQQSAASGFVAAAGLNAIVQTWYFALASAYFLLCLGLATAKRAFPFKRKNIAYLLNHFGLFLALFAAFAGSGDLQRLRMVCSEGKVEWRATNEAKQVVEMPFAIELNDFQMEEFPPKLAILDHQKSGLREIGGKPFLFSVEGKHASAFGCHFSVEKYLPLSGWVGDRFEPVNEPGATQSALIRVSSETSKMSQTGWISCGSFRNQPMALKLDSLHSLIMLPAQAKKYSSQVRIITQNGGDEQHLIEVNKPVSVMGWKLYQIDYDTQKGRWSETSVIELVRDPWLPVVYVGVFILMAGTFFLVWNGRRREQL